jgi:hypothetical protein
MPVACNGGLATTPMNRVRIVTSGDCCFSPDRIAHNAKRSSEVVVRPLCGTVRELCTRFERASCGGLQPDGGDEGIEVTHHALVEAVEAITLVVGEP